MESKIRTYVAEWERRCYTDGIPDEVPAEIADLVPSYKRIALAILRNDHILKSLGFTPPVSKWYGIYKRIEIEARNGNNTPRDIPEADL